MGRGRVWPASLWGVLKGALEDEPCDRVDVYGGHLAAKAHRFEGDGAAAGERVEHPGRASAVGLANLVTEPIEVRPVLAAPVEDAARCLLLHLLDRASVQPPAFDLLDHAPGHALQDSLALLSVARIGKQSSNQCRARRSQRSPCRPDVQRRDMPVPHVLLMHGVERGLLQREGDFDEALVGGHALSLIRGSFDHM